MPAPSSPFGPCGPCGPWGPGSPCGPGSPFEEITLTTGSSEISWVTYFVSSLKIIL